jgi:CMP-N-acetylneuraminic acid synthetase
MYKGKLILATICARGGSKGVKNKNIRLLKNKPLIEYSLEIINQSSLIDGYIVSTDSDDIINVVKRLGFKIEFKRPSYLAGDNISRIEAIKHAVLWKEKTERRKYDFIADIGVATPLKTSSDLDEAVILCIDGKADNVFSVCPCARNPYFNMVEVIDGKVKLVKENLEITTRQQAPMVYEMNDGFNIWSHDSLFSDNPQFKDSTKIYIMPRERSIDIDEEEDFRIAEMILNKQ